MTHSSALPVNTVLQSPTTLSVLMKHLLSSSLLFFAYAVWSMDADESHWNFERDYKDNNDIPQAPLGYLSANSVCMDLVRPRFLNSDAESIVAHDPNAYELMSLHWVHGTAYTFTWFHSSVEGLRHIMDYFCFDTAYGDPDYNWAKYKFSDRETALVGLFYLECPVYEIWAGNVYDGFRMHAPKISYRTQQPLTSVPLHVAMYQPTCFNYWTYRTITIMPDRLVCVDIPWDSFAPYVKSGRQYRIMAWIMSDLFPGRFSTRWTVPTFVPKITVGPRGVLDYREMYNYKLLDHGTTGIVVPLNKVLRDYSYSACAEARQRVPAELHIGIELLGPSEY